MKWLIGAVAVAGLTADSLWRRSRAAGFQRLTPASEPVSSSHLFLTAPGVRLDEETRRAASAHARREDLDVLDLIPEGLDTARTLELIRHVNPRRYRAARLAVGAGAGHAVLVDERVLARAAATPGTPDSGDLTALTTRLKRYAPTTTDLAIAPGLDPLPPAGPATRRADLRRIWLSLTPTALALQGLGLGFLGAGAARRSPLGLPALAVWSLQPYLATVGTAFRPYDLHRFALGRPGGGTSRWFQVVRAPERQDETLPARRAAYAKEIAAGVGRFFEYRRSTCPWCEGTELGRWLVSGDYQQHKPGTFRLDRCRGCGHIFQNPRLTPEGLEFYYRGYYDGDGAAQVDFNFRLGDPHYRDRAAMVGEFTGPDGPAAWLDVGAGHGHFCNVARDVWPDTRFDGLDMGEGIAVAERQGWVDYAHRGQFPELAPRLAGRYDVISMHHYLEHVLDPAAELDAAAKALPPGGLLLIEVPDPESPFGRLAGRWWHNWFQPQHLHFIPAANLGRALADRGLTVLALDRRTGHQPLDLMTMAVLMLHRLVRDPATPWSDPRLPRLRGAARTAIFTAGAPLIVGCGAIDQLLAPVVNRAGGANCYRILARRPPEGSSENLAEFTSFA